MLLIDPQVFFSELGPLPFRSSGDLTLNFFCSRFFHLYFFWFGMAAGSYKARDRESRGYDEGFGPGCFPFGQR